MLRTVAGFCLLFSILAFAQPIQAKDREEVSFEIDSHIDVPYYEGEDADSVKHKLDLFLPRDRKNFPVLFFVHGGAWRQGDKSQFGVYRGLGKSFARHGIGAVVTNYRLSPGVKHPTHIEDVARAFAWTCKNIERYGGHPDQIFVCGHSAGGHLVALLGSDEQYLRKHNLSSKNICGVIPISGVYDIPDKILPSVFPLDDKIRDAASPISHAKKGLPPFLICYADNDYPMCGKPTSEAFASALRDKGVPVSTREFEKSNHYVIILAAALPEKPVFQAIYNFILEQAK